VCGVPSQNCNGVCTNVTTDASNCGTCGHACATGQSCSNGTCTGGTTLTGCLGYLQCWLQCADATCTTTCRNKATSQGQQLFDALLSCVEGACPGFVTNSGGGVCDASQPACSATVTTNCYNDTNCNTCLSTAQATGGNCFSAQQACAANTP
jgi:hypothetical protein